MKPKIKLSKNVDVWFDGTFVGTPHWISYVDRVELGDKALNALMQAGTKFSNKYNYAMRENPALFLGAKSEIPDGGLQKCFDEYTKSNPKNAVTYSITNFQQRAYDGAPFRAVFVPANKPVNVHGPQAVCIDTDYVPLLDGCDKITSQGIELPLVGWLNGKPVCIVMSIRMKE